MLSSPRQCQSLPWLRNPGSSRELNWKCVVALALPAGGIQNELCLNCWPGTVANMMCEYDGGWGTADEPQLSHKGRSSPLPQHHSFLRSHGQ